MSILIITKCLNFIKQIKTNTIFNKLVKTFVYYNLYNM